MVQDPMFHESVVIDEPCSIGGGTRIWHFTHVMPHSSIGKNCVIGQNAFIGANVTIGDNCKLQNNVSIYEGVTLERGVFCGPSCVFTNVRNPRAEISRKNEIDRTFVREGATLGANSTVVCGHELGAFCFVAAGAVVTSNVAAHALMLGVPARRVGWVSHAGERLDEGLVCPREGRKYSLNGENLREITLSKGTDYINE